MSPKLELYVSYIYDKIKLCNKAHTRGYLENPAFQVFTGLKVRVR